MSQHIVPPTTRRAFLRLCLVAPVPALLAACTSSPPSAPAPASTSAPEPTAIPATSAPKPTAIPATSVPAQPTAAPTKAVEPTAEPPVALALTPACDDGDEPTIAQTEGPYFTPNSPERTVLFETGMAGTPMTLLGGVFTSGCRPVARALIDLWHCDAAGVYDNVGYTLRGHTYTDDQGRFQFETVQPGLYPGRTRHFHIKVQAPNSPILTTQLYFPDEPDNATDGIFSNTLLMDIQQAANQITGTYTFVVQA